MKNTIKKIATAVATLTFFASATGGVLLGFAEGNNAQNSPASVGLWEETSGFTVTKNVDVPDYMKYGAFVHYSDTTKLYTVDENSQEDYMEDWEKNGVQLTSSVPGKKMYYSNVVNIDSFTTSDDLLVFTPLSSKRGAPDFTEIEFVLEDVENPENYLQITIKENSWYTQNIMIAVSTPNVSARGYRYGDNGEISPNGCADVVSVSFRGYTVEPGKHKPKDQYNDYRHRAIKLHYDVAKKLVSVTGQAGRTYPVLDLDDGHSVGYGNAWEGFTSNRVRLSVSMNAFSASEASLLMLKAFNQSMNGETFVDAEKPVFHFDEIAKEIPYAQVGKAYPVYGCVCDDTVSGKITPNVFLTNPQGETAPLTEKSFTPNQAGLYKLTYQAQDVAGNNAEKTYPIIAQHITPKINIDVEAETTEFTVGQKIVLPTPTVSGGSGDLSYEVSVRRVGGETIETKDGYFIPRIAGTYHVVYKATDYLKNTATKTVSYTVESTEKPVWSASMQKLVKLFDGISVQLPQPIAYDYTSVLGNQLNAEYEIVAENSDGSYEEKIENRVFTPKKEKFGEEVTIRYTVYCKGNQAKYEEFSYSVPLVDVPEQVNGYFNYNENEFNAILNGKDESDFLRFTTVEGVLGEKSFSFVNPLVADGFAIAFAIPANETNFETFTIQLRDSENAEIGLDLELRDIVEGKDRNSMTYLRTGGVDYAMNGTYNTISNGVEAGSKIPLSLQYSKGNIIDYQKKCVCTPTIGFNGEKFEGFPSGKVYVTFVFKGITGTAGVTLTKLANQIFYADYAKKTGELVPFEDVNAPQIFLEEDIPDKFSFRQTVEIPYAEAFDALSPYIQTYVTLCAPDGTYIYQNEPCVRGMRFVIEQYGNYSLTYTAKDVGKNPTDVDYTIAAKDVIAPTVVVSGRDELSCSAGRKMNIPQAVVQDNNDQSPRLFIMIMKPDYSMITLGERTAENTISSYTFAQKGKYRIRYYAVDGNYNVTIVDILVNVG